MIRQPDVKSAAAMLRAALAEEGVMLSHQKSLNLAARMDGFKNWAHAQAMPAPSKEQSASEPALASREAELSEALAWVSRNYVTTLSGKPVRDADECLSYAGKLLGKPVDSCPAEPAPAFAPRKVDWASVLAFEDFTHVKVNDNVRELCHVHHGAFDDQASWSELATTDAVTNRLVFAYTVAEANGYMKEIRISDLLNAIEVEPGFIRLADGRTLQLLVEEQTWWLAYSPAAGDTL